ncbi:MAG: WG repeat-containing protein [Sphingobacteriales bacterium]|nr:MAG: WG repeat-containing protein [Sphingobacteriales bacterium]
MMNRLLILACFILIATGLSAQQIDMSMIPYRQGDKWGFSDPGKNVVIAPKYNEVQWFSEGYAAVKVGSKWGYINKAGKLVIPARYTVAKSFRKGFVPRVGKEGGDSVLFAGVSIKADGYENCIDTKGNVTVKCPAIPENSVPENRGPVETVVTQKNYSVPNNNGLFDKIVDDYKIAGSDETYYIAEKGGRYGVFNTKFETIVPFEYDEIKMDKKSASPYLAVKKSGMYGIATTQGQMKILPENTNVFAVKANDGKEYIIVKKDGKTYVKDMENQLVIPDGYNDIVYDNGGFILTGNDNMRGYYFIDKTNPAIAPKYTDIKSVNGSNYLMVKTFSGKTGYISSSGNEYFIE